MWRHNGAVCITHDDVRRASKGMGYSLPSALTDEVIAQIGGIKIVTSDPPEHDALSQIAEFAVIDDAQVWTVRDKTEAELQAMRVAMQVSMRQARLALLQAGYLDAVPNAIAAIEDPATRSAAEIEWEYAHVVDRLSPIIATVRPLLGMTEGEMDQLFATAKTL